MSKILPLKTKKMSNKKKSLADKHLSYVLITCTPPSAEGKMNVELEYEGDRDLIAYLMESAQGYFD